MLELDGPAAELKPVPVPVASLTFGKKVTASSVYPEPVGQQYLPAFAVDGDPESGWTFAKDLKSAWLEVDLGQPYKFDTAEIHERYDRVRGFRIQVKQGDQWVTIHARDADRRGFLHDVSASHRPVRPPGSPRHDDQPAGCRVSRVRGLASAQREWQSYLGVDWEGPHPFDCAEACFHEGQLGFVVPPDLPRFRRNFRPMAQIRAKDEALANLLDPPSGISRKPI